MTDPTPRKGLLIIGPLPPPLHGKSAATQALASALSDSGLEVNYVDISEGTSPSRAARLARKVGANARSIGAALLGAGPVYVSANAGGGMWLSAVACAAARLRRRRLLIHHHSYDYVAGRKFRMAVLARMAGPQSTHLVLGASMASELALRTHEIRSTFVLNNAGLVDECLLQLPPRNDDAVVLGHLSNLTAQKGVAGVIDLATAALEHGLSPKLILAGPANDDVARHAIDRAAAMLGDKFEYRGPVYDDDKRRFFADISHFVFPTRYKNEASPLVLFEAMAAGVPCIATARGCIAEDLGSDGGIAIPEQDDFIVGALDYLVRSSEDYAASSHRARQRYLTLLAEHEKQIEELVSMLR